MYIKQVKIDSFKSYGQQTLKGELSPQLNVIVGPNGNGKSNYLNGIHAFPTHTPSLTVECKNHNCRTLAKARASHRVAIMFVLSNKYSNLPLDEKRRIIHETEGAEAKKAVSVELVLNNKGRKLPIESDNVTIKRVFDSEAKRDEYYVNGKHIHKMDLRHILEATGLSFANPFYFVQQGRISSIIGLNEVQLFVFISEVAGTQVYDEKRSETLRSLDEAKQKRTKLSVLLGKIDAHIERLSKDAKLLKQYKRIENEKQALEYRVLELRTGRVAEKLMQMADEREETMRNFEHSKNQEQALKIERDTVEKEKHSREWQINALKEKLEQLAIEKHELETVLQRNESAQEVTTRKAKEVEEELAALETPLLIFRLLAVCQ